MIDPSKLKAGQRLELKQNKNGVWQEWIVDKEGQILAVEDVRLFEKSKLESQEPNNYEELKKNYKYLSKTDQSPPPISINEPLSPLTLNDPETEIPNCEPDDPEIEEEPEEVRGEEPDPETDRDIDQEIKEQEKEPTDRECEVKENDSEE